MYRGQHKWVGFSYPLHMVAVGTFTLTLSCERMYDDLLSIWQKTRENIQKRALQTLTNCYFKHQLPRT